MRELNLAVDSLDPIEDSEENKKRPKDNKTVSEITSSGQSLFHPDIESATVPLDEVIVKEKLTPFAKENIAWNNFYNTEERINDLIQQNGEGFIPEATPSFVNISIRDKILKYEDEIKNVNIDQGIGISDEAYQDIFNSVLNNHTALKKVRDGILGAAQKDFNNAVNLRFNEELKSWNQSEQGQRLTDLQKTYGPGLENLTRGDENRQEIINEYNSLIKGFNDTIVPKHEQIQKDVNEEMNLDSYYNNHIALNKEFANIQNLIGEALTGYNRNLNRKALDIDGGLGDFFEKGKLTIKSGKTKNAFIFANEDYKKALNELQNLENKENNDLVEINSISNVSSDDFKFETIAVPQGTPIIKATVPVEQARKYFNKVAKEKQKESLSLVADASELDRVISFYDKVEINSLQDFFQNSLKASAEQLPQMWSMVTSLGTSVYLQESGNNYYEQLEDFITANEKEVLQQLRETGKQDTKNNRLLAASELGAGNAALSQAVGIINTGVEALEYGALIAGLGGKFSAMFLKELYEGSMKKLIDAGLTVSATSLVSGSQEIIQSGVSETGRSLAMGINNLSLNPLEAFGLYKGPFTDPKQTKQEFLIGASAILPISIGTISVKEVYSQIQKEISKKPNLKTRDFIVNLQSDLEQSFANQEITEEEYLDGREKIAQLQELDRKIPNTIKGEDKIKAAELLNEKSKLVKEKEQIEQGLSQEIDLELQDIDNKISEIGEKQVADKKAVSEKNIKIAETNKELMAIIKDPELKRIIEDPNSTKIEKGIAEKKIQKAKDDITKLNEGLRFDIIKRRYDPTKDTGLDRSQVESGVNKIFAEAINTFTPDKGEFGAYVRGIINVRFPEVFGQVETRIDSSGKKQVVSKQDVSGMELAGESVSQPDLDQKETLRIKKLLTKKIGFDTAELEGEFKTDKDGNQVPKTFADVFADAVAKTFGTKLPSVTNKKDFVKEFSKSNIAQLMPFVRDITKIDRKNKIDKFKPFIIKNFKPILDQLPESVINKKYDMLRKPVLKESGKQKRESTKEGKGEFEYLNIDRKDFVDYFTNKNPDVIATAAGNITFKNDKGIESELRVNAKNGKPLIGKRLGDQITIDGQQVELTKIEVGSSTLSDRRTSLLNTIIDELSADAALEVIKDESIMDKFKQVQELEGKEVPTDFLDKIVDALNRGIKYLDDMQNNSSLRVGFVLPELAMAFLKNVLKFLKVGIKAGQEFASSLDSAVEEAAKEPDSQLRNNEEIDAVKKVAAKNFKSEKDLTDAKINKTTKEVGGVIFQDRLIRGLENTIFPYIGAKLSGIKNPELRRIKATNLLSNLTRGISWSADYLKKSKTPKGKKLTKLAFNKNILTELKKVLPKDYFGKDAINIKGNKFYYGSEKIQNIQFTEAGNVVRRGKKAFDDAVERSYQAKQQGLEFLINLRADVEAGIIDENTAEDLIDIAKNNQKGIIRRMALPNILFDYKEGTKYIAEHDSPMNDLIENFIKPYIKGEVNLDKLKNEIDNQRVNYVSTEFNDAIPTEFKDKKSDKRYDNPLREFKGQYTEFNPINLKEKELRGRITVLTENLIKGDLKNLTEGQAISLGKKANRFKIILPYGAEDLLGLIYPLIRKGKLGDEDLKFFKENLFDPLKDAFNKYDSAKLDGMVQLRAIKEELKEIGLNLQEVAFDNISQDNAIRIHLWSTRGYKIPDGPNDVLSESQIEKANQWVRQNLEALNIKEIIEGAYEGRMYPEPGNNWRGETLTTDLLKSYNVTIRREYFADFFKIVEAMFGERKNNQITGEIANNLTAKLGTSWADAFNNMLTRIETGRHRNMPTDKYSNAFTNWINSAVSTIMFVNTRSVLLQTISNLNFINGSDNNIYSVAAAYGNVKQFVADFHRIFYSDFLKSRRSGLKIDVNLDELSQAAEGNNANRAEAMLAALLKKGFYPTQMADSFAIAFGGAPFFRNRTKTYQKEGFSLEEAEQKAFGDMRELAEESQQSSRQDKISMQQASGIGKLILAFQNYPMQATRIQKRAVQDLLANRGNPVKNVRRILYYGALQNVLFHFLQSAAFYIFINKDELKDEEEEKRLYGILNRMADTILAGSGFNGVIAASIKNVVLELADEFSDGGQKNTREALIRSTAFSPPINSKLRKVNSAFQRFERKQEREKMGDLSFENPFLKSSTELIEAATNLPANRVLRKVENVKLALDKETDFWRSIFLTMGYNKYDLFMYDFQKDGEDTTFRKRKPRKQTKERKPLKTN